MNKRRWSGRLLALVFFIPASLMAQTSNSNSVSTVVVVLTRTVESKGAIPDLELNLRTISDVVVGGEVVIPRGSKIACHVSEAITKGKDEPQSVLAIVVDKAVTGRGVEIPLQAIVAAIAAPPNNSLAGDPTYGMMHSNEPKMLGNGPGSAASTGSLSSGSKARSTAAVATADLKGKMDETSLLNENSQGAAGYEGLSISWHLIAPPPITVFASNGKNVKLNAGTQMLLRMATPQLPR